MTGPAAVLTLTLALGGLLAGAAAPAQAAEPVDLAIEAPERAAAGEEHMITVRLADADGQPLEGETVVVAEELRFFTYADTRRLGEAQTRHDGTASVPHQVTGVGEVTLVADYPGSEDHAGASATARVDVAAGTAPAALAPGATVEAPGAPGELRDPLLPRGVTAVWFVPLLLGLWLAIAAAVYQAVRIPLESRRRAAEPGPDG